MITAVPMIAIHTDTKGLILINGRPAGSAGGVLSIPTNAFGEVFITVLPEGDFLPRSVRLNFHSGAPLLEDGDCEHIVWPGGVSEVFIPAKPVSAVLPFEKIDSLTVSDIEYSLYKGDFLKLIAQDTYDNSVLFERSIHGGLTGSLRELESPISCVGALCDIKDGKQRLILLTGDRGKISCAADESGTRLKIEGSSLLCRDDLGDIAGHVRLKALSADGNRLIETQEELVVLESVPLDPNDTATAFMQAVQLGLEDEAFSYLAPAYSSSLTFSELSAFLGDFERVEKARYCPELGGQSPVALIRRSAKNAYTASIYAFEFEENRISLIKRYEG